MKTQQWFGSNVKLLAIGASIVLFFGSGTIFQALSAVTAPRIFEPYHNILYCALLVLIAIPFYWGLSRYYPPSICSTGLAMTGVVLICAGVLKDMVGVPWWIETVVGVLVAGAVVTLAGKAKGDA